MREHNRSTLSLYRMDHQIDVDVLNRAPEGRTSIEIITTVGYVYRSPEGMSQYNRSPEGGATTV